MVNIESNLFVLLTRTKSLPHPTARNFDRDKWLNAAKELGALSTRDQQLLDAALHFGTEIRALRSTYEPSMFEGCDQRTGIVLSVAMANYNFLILTKLAAESTRKHIGVKDGPISVGSIARQPISGPYPGNISNADSAVAAIVDTLPHCIERAFRLPDGGETPTRDFWKRGSNLFAVLSIEHSLRDLWQAVLWDGWALRRSKNVLRLDPTDIELDTLWNVWNWRQEMVIGQSTMLDSIDKRMTGEASEPIAPFQDPTVVGIGGHSKSDRRFRFGSVSGRGRGQMWHATEDAILAESYLAPFVDATLPSLAMALSCTDIQSGWRVLRDCAAILSSKCKKRDLSDVNALERYALLIRRSEVERAISHCNNVSPEKAKAVVDFLICDLSDTSSLFTKGFWASPIISIDSGENLLITLAAVSVGSTIRRVESWLDRGGLSDRLATARRGLRYEAWVREELERCIVENPLLQNARCAKDGVSRQGETGEQIDLLIRLGDLLIVGEVKCLLAPVESMEHFNYLSKLNGAGEQAVRKAKWILENLDVVAELLKLTTAEVQQLRLVPIVILNQGFGFGLLAGGARVIDFHYLRLYLKDGEYATGTAFNFDEKRAMSQFHVLYRSEDEAESHFEETMANPPTIARFTKSAVWHETKFPMSNGEDLEIAVCNFNDQRDQNAKDLVSAVSS
jgi:hypothetical protein